MQKAKSHTNFYLYLSGFVTRGVLCSVIKFKDHVIRGLLNDTNIKNIIIVTLILNVIIVEALQINLST